MGLVKKGAAAMAAAAWLAAGPAGAQVPAPEDSAALELPEAAVKAKRIDDASVKVKSDFIRKIPGAMNDPVRAAGLAPGVSVQNDVNVRPLVRGGDEDQTRVVMDGMPLLQPYHVGGSFSLFNLNTLEAVELYRDDFPVEYPGALSGVLRLKSNERMPSGLHARSSLSMIRGDAYAEVPIVSDGLSLLSVYGAAQSFLLNRSLRGLLDISSALSGDSAFHDEMAGYRERVNMPDFQDYHFGATLLRGDVRAHYMGGLSSDGYQVIVPKQTNILSKINPHIGDPTALPLPSPSGKEQPRSRKLSVDHVSAVDVGNGSHFLDVTWDATPDNLIENGFGFQSQAWDVDFKQGMEATQGLALSQSTRYFNYRFADTYSPSREHRFTFGASYDYREQRYRINLPYALYDVIVNGNMDMLEPLGYFSDRGFALAKEDSTRGNFDYLGEFPSRIHFAHDGVLEERFGGLFFSHAWSFGSGSLTYGVRGEYHQPSGEFFPAPRLDYRWAVDARDDLLFTAGLYAQNDLPFQERDGNPSLRSEKSGQLGLQWTRRIGKGYRVVLEGYYKRYYDLAAPTLVPDGTLDLKGLLLPLPNSTLAPGEIARLKAVLDTAKDMSSLPDSLQRLAYANFGGLAFNYASTGVGNALGTGIALYYEPGSAWSGWVSAEWGLSNRKDSDRKPYYPFAYDRPASFTWVNTFAVPGGGPSGRGFELGWTYRWALGRPYTPYSGGSGGKDSIFVGARNSGRLSPYSRLDLRLSRNSRWWRRSFTSYVEVWNATNSPNYFARDSETGELKAAQLNWPFPIFFVGMSADL
jgi:hypothetical protein